MTCGAHRPLWAGTGKQRPGDGRREWPGSRLDAGEGEAEQRGGGPLRATREVMGAQPGGLGLSVAVVSCLKMRRVG